MTQRTELLQDRYRGVSCSRCRQPIPVSTLVGNMEGGLHTFALRCRACEGEGIYTIGHIQNFEGEPRLRHFDFLRGRLSRAANG